MATRMLHDADVQEVQRSLCRPARPTQGPLPLASLIETRREDLGEVQRSIIRPEIGLRARDQRAINAGQLWHTRGTLHQTGAEGTIIMVSFMVC